VRCRERERERERESRVEVENLRGVRACENGTHNLQKKKKKKLIYCSDLNDNAS